MNVQVFDHEQLMKFEANQAKPYVPILCLDFDGVLHSYAEGWQGATVIPGEPVPGAMEFLVKAVQHFSVHIYSNRCNLPHGITAIRFWLIRQIQLAFKHVMTEYDAECIVSQLWFDTLKPPAHLLLDDRAFQFRGKFPSMEYLKNFQPWYKPQSDYTDEQLDRLWQLIKAINDCKTMTDADLGYALQHIWAKYNLDSKESWVLMEAIERLLPIYAQSNNTQDKLED